MEIASRTDAKVSTIFSLRSAYTGDGNSKETAIFFHKARTNHEQAAAFYKYLEDNKLEMHRRQVAAVENGYILELVIVTNRHLWVKYTMSE